MGFSKVLRVSRYDADPSGVCGIRAKGGDNRPWMLATPNGIAR